MRSNGLVAFAYAPIADLDPRVATSLLDDLAALGVAAYTKPVETSTSVGFERSDFRIGVRDRLYVDVTASAQVRELVAAQDQELVYDNDDLAWAKLVAGYDQPSDSPVAPWPTQEDLDPIGEPPGSATVGDDPAPWSGGFPYTDRRRGHGWTDLGRPVQPADSDVEGSLNSADAPQHAARRRRDDENSDASRGGTDDEESFVPDPPPPLPALAPYKMLAWIALVGGPALLLLSALLGVLLPVWVTLAAVGGFMVGFITLVATMDDRGDGDWTSGNGAVV